MNNLTTQEWVSIIIWILILFLFRSLGIVLAIVIACVVSFGFLAICDMKADSTSSSENKPSKEKRETPATPPMSNIEVSELNSAVEALIQEATETINDFLEVGSIACLFSDTSSFYGCIHVVADARPPFSGKYTNYGIHIVMCDLEDLRNGPQRYPKMYYNNPLEAGKLDRFINKYGSSYNPSELRYEYRTKHTVPIKGNKNKEAERENLRKSVLERVAKECPLADYNGHMLYNKSVYH